MKTILAPLFILMLLPLFQSCGGGKATAKLEVSKAFAVTNPYFGGGLMVFGKNSATGQRFSIALDSSLQKTVSLDQGTWDFFAMGWDGNTGSNIKFGGTKYCGMTTQTLSSASTVELVVDQTKCSDVNFKDQVQPSVVKVLTCGAFYDYTQNTNTFSPVNTSTLDNYCDSLPMDLQSQFTHYRLVALEYLNGVITPKFQSACTPVVSGTFSFPLRKFPFRIKAYRSQTDCLSTTAVYETFDFPEGVNRENKTVFDNILQVDTPSVGNARLFLASGISRRGYSPFMAQAPRILCGAAGSYADCMPDISPGYDLFVPWDSTNKDGIKIFRNTTATSCDSTILSPNPYFSAIDCKIEEGEARVSLIRNAITMHESIEFDNIKDMVFKNNKIYVLRLNGVPMGKVQVYSLQGENLFTKDLDFIPHTMDVDSSGNVYVADTSQIRKYNGDWSSPTVTSIASGSIEHIAVDDSGNIYAAIQDSSLYYLRSYNLGTPSPLGSQPLTTYQIDQLQLINGHVYILQSLDATTKYKKFPVTGTNIGAVSDIGNISATSFYNDGTNLFTVSGTSINTLDGVLASIDSATSSATSGILKAGDYVITYSSSGIKVNLAGNLSTEIANPGDSQEQNLTFNLAGKTITLYAFAKKPAVFPLFQDVYEFIGRQYFVSGPQHIPFLFQQHHDDVKVSSGGKLNDAFADLTPAGLAGLIPKELGIDCNTLKTSLAVAPFSKTINIFDPFKARNHTVNISLQTIADAVSNYFCDPSDPTVGSCSSNYDIKFTYSISSSDWTDTGVFKISCSAGAGSLERKEYSQTEGTRRKLTLWQTMNPTRARYEEYEYANGHSNIRGVLTSLEKTSATNLWLRSVSVETSSSQTTGRALQLERNATSFLSLRKDLHDEVSFTNFFSRTDNVQQYAETFDNIVGQDSFNGYASQHCMPVGTTDITINTGSCGLTELGSGGYNSKGWALSIDSLSDINASPLINTVYQIP